MDNQQNYIDESKSGYRNTGYDFPTKRYYQTLDLRNDPLLIEEYKKRHNEKHYWPQVGEGIRSVGILNMEIYLYESRLVMVVEAALDFDWDTAFARLAGLPRQSEWEEYMSAFQLADASVCSSEKWRLMERIFHLP